MRNFDDLPERERDEVTAALERVVQVLELTEDDQVTVTLTGRQVEIREGSGEHG